MKRKIIYFLFFFLLLTFFAGKALTQEPGATSLMSQNQIRTCLAAKPGNFDCPQGKDEGGACEELGSATQMNLTGTCEAPAGCEIWEQGSGRLARKGEPAIPPTWRKVYDFVAAGPVDVTLTGTWPSHISYKFFAIGDAPVTTDDTGGAGIEEENQTQQIGQVSNFTFPQTEGSEQKCASIYWDPFGRVFDAVSLEPMSNVNVSLLQSSSGNLVFVPTNPDLTDEAGVYNILIDKEDDYYLDVDSPATHLFTENFQLEDSFDKIYTNIYSPGEVFHEAPLPGSIPADFDLSPYIHDIPLQPQGEPYKDAVAEVVEDSLNQVDLNDFVSYYGRVTYPMAQVCLTGATSGVVACTSADQYGNFNVSVDKLSLPQELIEIKVEKVDLTTL